MNSNFSGNNNVTSSADLKKWYNYIKTMWEVEEVCGMVVKGVKSSFSIVGSQSMNNI